MLDFAALPPEINSTRMYTGPGSGPMMTAATGWDAVAAQLESFATGYSSALTSLQGQSWSGPASASMISAASPYVAWANTTATQAEQAAGQARAAAAAYETAHAATVPPAAVAANRAQLMVLVATNFFGQNAPAIAANEATYSEMWAQDAAAMHGYAEASAPAATLSPFEHAPQTTNAGGQGAQNAAVAHATGTSTAENSHTSLSQLLSSIPQQLQTLSTPQNFSSYSTSSALVPNGSNGTDLLHGVGTIATAQKNFVFLPYTFADFSQLPVAAAQLSSAAGKTGITAPSPALVGEMHGVESAGARGAVLASAGNAAPVGNLSVPQSLSVPKSWSAATQTASTEARPLQLASAGHRAAAAEAAAAPKPMAGHPSPLIGPMSQVGQQRRGTPVFRMRDRRFRMPRPPAAG